MTTNVDFSLLQCCPSLIHCCTFTENRGGGEERGGEVKFKVSGINLVCFSRILQSQLGDVAMFCSGLQVV